MPVVILTYERREDAQSAIEKYNGLIADGSKISVSYVQDENEAAISTRVSMPNNKNMDLLAPVFSEPAGCV